MGIKASLEPFTNKQVKQEVPIGVVYINCKYLSYFTYFFLFLIVNQFFLAKLCPNLDNCLYTISYEEYEVQKKNQGSGWDKIQKLNYKSALEPFIVDLVHRKYQIAVMPDMMRRKKNFILSPFKCIECVLANAKQPDSFVAKVT